MVGMKGWHCHQLLTRGSLVSVMFLKVRSTRSCTYMDECSPLLIIPSSHLPNVRLNALHNTDLHGSQSGDAQIAWCLAILQETSEVFVDVGIDRRDDGRVWMDG